MAYTALLQGSLPFGVPIRGWEGYAGFFESRSFDFSTKRAPMCWLHWREDDYIFVNEATVLKASDALVVIHVLDLRMPQERAVLDLATAGACFLSFGPEATPDASRAYSASFSEAYASGRLGSSPRPFSFGKAELGHVCYATAGAIEQQPVQVILTI